MGDKSNDTLILLCKINKRETDKPRKSDIRNFWSVSFKIEIVTILKQVHLWDVTFILSKTSCQYKNLNDTSIPINTSFNPLPLRPPRKSSSNLLKQAEKYRLQIPPVLKFWTIQNHYMTKELTNLSTYHLHPTLHKDNQAIRQMRQQFQKNKYHLA